MKRLLWSLVLIGFFSPISFGEIVFDYTISDTYDFSVTLNSEFLLITGAGALVIDAFGESYVEVQNTAALLENIGGIYDLNLNDFSTMNYYGGETGGLDIRGDATATFSGGRIDYISSYQDSDLTKHITFIADLDSIDLTGNLLTGNWLDDSSFSITLLDQTSYDIVYSNINSIRCRIHFRLQNN